MSTLSTTFTYAAIQPDAAAIAQAAANVIRVNLRKQVDAVVAVGQQLIAVKNALDHGQFGAWLKAENLFAETTAQNFMRVAKEIGPKTAIVADLPLALVYKMSSPLVPQDLRQQLLARRESGETVEKEEIEEAVSIAISKAKQAAKEAAKEERLSAAAKARRKRAREKELADQERLKIKFEKRRQEQLHATETAAVLIRQKLGPDIEALLALLEDAWSTGIFDEVKAPGILREREAERERRDGY